MDWKELFERSWRGDEAEVKVYDHLRLPDKLTDLDGVTLYDRSAARVIKEMEEYLEALKGYRQALAERYAALASMPYTLRLDLVRRNGWSDKKVTYPLSLVRVYQDGHEQDEERTVYPGTERREAIKKFEAMQHERPGIQCRVQIEKASWER